MRVSKLSVLATSGAVALGQSLAGLPTCAQSAALQGALNSGCSDTTGAACLCDNAGFVSSIKSAIAGSCTGTDQQAACQWGNSQCAANGVSIPCDSLVASSGSSADNGAATSATAGTTSAPAASTSGMATSSPTAIDSGVSATVSSSSGMASLSMSTSSILSMMTSTRPATNRTMTTHTCMTSCGNMTHSATMSATGSGPTSQYTGAASVAARQGGFLQLVAGVAVLFAFL